MSNKGAEKIVKQFGMSNFLIETNIRKLQDDQGIDLGHGDKSTVETDQIYEHFQKDIRLQAKKMAEYYEIFFCLENSIRDLISDVLSEQAGQSWWDSCVAQQVQQEVAKRIKREKSEGVSTRSEDPLHYTNFGELAEIIVGNWKYFDDILADRTATTRIISKLNTLRAPIAHCCELPPDEVDRLKLSMKDWFRLMP